MNKKKDRLSVKIIKTLAAFIVMGILYSCSSIPANLTVPKETNFSNYKSVNIIGFKESYLTEFYNTELEKTFALSGFNVINDDRIRLLNSDERSQLMMVNVDLTNDYYCSYGTLIITDYNSGKLLWSIKTERSIKATQDRVFTEMRNKVEKAIKK